MACQKSQRKKKEAWWTLGWNIMEPLKEMEHKKKKRWSSLDKMMLSHKAHIMWPGDRKHLEEVTEGSKQLSGASG